MFPNYYSYFHIYIAEANENCEWRDSEFQANVGLT